ncbi:hypothetical protein ACFCXH_26775 [Streptomyces nojiriensis]
MRLPSCRLDLLKRTLMASLEAEQHRRLVADAENVLDFDLQVGKS